jgi:hypothetical protein
MIGSSSATYRVIRVLLPLGILAAAATMVTAGAQEGSVVPGTPDPAGPPQAGVRPAPVREVKVPLEIRVLRAGPGPYAWAEKGRIAATFITSTPEALDVLAWAKIKGLPELERAVEWTVTPPEGFELADGSVLTGAKLLARLQRPEGNPGGAGARLSLTVTARVSRDGKSFEATRTLEQDPRDRLRQEYVDLERAYVPDRADLLDEAQFARRYGKKYPSVSFAELNWSRQPSTEERYPVILPSTAPGRLTGAR